MSIYSIKDLPTSTDRYKLYLLNCKADEITNAIDFIQKEKVHVLNLGKKLALYIDSLSDFRFLGIDVYDYTRKLLDTYKSKISNSGNDILAIYNLGILMEPSLELNAAQLLKEFSKSTALIIIWENHADMPNKLNWLTQQNKVFLDFSDTKIKELHHEI